MAKKKAEGSSTLNDVAERVGETLGHAAGTAERLSTQGMATAEVVRDVVVAEVIEAGETLGELQVRSVELVDRTKERIGTARAKAKAVVKTAKAKIATGKKVARRTVKHAKAAVAGARKRLAKAVAKGHKRATKAVKKAHKKTKKSKSR